MPTVMSLTSITVWGDTTSLLSGGRFDGASVTIGDANSVTGCMLTPNGSPAPRTGFAAMALVCGAEGRVVTLSLPVSARAPRPAAAGSVAVKVCAAGNHDGGMHEGALWLQA